MLVDPTRLRLAQEKANLVEEVTRLSRLAGDLACRAEALKNTISRVRTELERAVAPTGVEARALEIVVLAMREEG